MDKVENIQQLHAEINRLKNVAKQQELDIKYNWINVKESLQPATLIWNGISNLTGINMNKQEFFKDGIAYGVSLFIQRFILKSERNMEKRVYNVVDGLFDRIRGVMRNFTNAQARREERKADQ